MKAKVLIAMPLIAVALSGCEPQSHTELNGTNDNRSVAPGSATATNLGNTNSVGQINQPEQLNRPSPPAPRP